MNGAETFLAAHRSTRQGLMIPDAVLNYAARRNKEAAITAVEVTLVKHLFFQCKQIFATKNFATHLDIVMQKECVHRQNLTTSTVYNKRRPD